MDMHISDYWNAYDFIVFASRSLNAPKSKKIYQINRYFFFTLLFTLSWVFLWKNNTGLTNLSILLLLMIWGISPYTSFVLHHISLVANSFGRSHEISPAPGSMRWRRKKNQFLAITTNTVIIIDFNIFRWFHAKSSRPVSIYILVLKGQFTSLR